MPIDTSERVFEREIEYCLTHLGKKSQRYIKGNPKDYYEIGRASCRERV